MTIHRNIGAMGLTIPATSINDGTSIRTWSSVPGTLYGFWKTQCADARWNSPKHPCAQALLLKKYAKFVKMRRDLYKKLANTADSPDDLDKKVRKAMEKIYKKARSSGEIKLDGKQRTAGHYDPCTGEKVVHDLCKLVKEKPLCNWLNKGTNAHEQTHEMQAKRDWDDQRRYCSVRLGGQGKVGARIAGKWEYEAYDRELKIYNNILEKLKKSQPECFKVRI